MQLTFRLGERLCDEFVKRLQNKLHKSARPTTLGWASAELASGRLEVNIPPQTAGEGGGIETGKEFRIHAGKGAQAVTIM